MVQPAISVQRSHVQIQSPNLFDSLVRALFTQRRKTTLNALKPFVDQRNTLPPLETCHWAGVDPKRRPEDLKLSELTDLTGVLACAQK